LCCDIGVKEPEVETASNSAIEPDTDITKMMENELTVKLYQQHLHDHKLVSIDVKLPTMDDVADFTAANELWKATAP